MHVSAFQELMKQLYFKKDEERGLQNTMLWFFEETGEFAEALRKFTVDENEKNKVRNKKNIGEEMADIIAWLSSMANLLNIDLEEELKKKYPDKCRKCGKNPCHCRHI